MWWPWSRPPVGRHLHSTGGWSFLEAEVRRQSNVLARLREQYNRTHERRLAPDEPLPKGWTDAQLAALGEYWRRRDYWS